MTWTVHVWSWRFTKGHHGGEQTWNRRELEHIGFMTNARVKLWGDDDSANLEITWQGVPVCVSTTTPASTRDLVRPSAYCSGWQIRGRRILYETSDPSERSGWEGRVYLCTYDTMPPPVVVGG